MFLWSGEVNYLSEFATEACSSFVLTADVKIDVD